VRESTTEVGSDGTRGWCSRSAMSSCYVAVRPVSQKCLERRDEVVVVFLGR
jgi:hypothetical protein